MAHKVALIADPGIDTAVAIAAALYDPQLEVVGIAATAGNISAEEATRNVQIVVDNLDPPRWPRLGEALPVRYEVEGTRLHGSGGLGGISWPYAGRHRTLPSDKLLVELTTEYADELTLVCLGPLTVLARALDREPQLAKRVRQIVVVGGAWREPGNASAVAEFHFYCDPEAARQVLHCGAPIILVPLDVTRQLLVSPAEIATFTDRDTRACRFLRKILHYGVGATSRLYGIEGFHLKDVLGISVLTCRHAFHTRPMTVDVETRGELTRGMSVVDLTPRRAPPNVDMVTEVHLPAVREHLHRVFRRYLCD
ncbi:MAG: nucleoside hydrolase [Gemmatales bacterium]|nr:nucleoside hydrolase [Gemmatales bacterium]MCS7160693.1 nucleoside hydrolase [Gemmatales bacterium]MDW8175894.1 nucleoside hydrolase [Gemmatales bacterium]MDW8223337.1 nucleoside hydrolase [Gemmatales bacterium]